MFGLCGLCHDPHIILLSKLDKNGADGWSWFSGWGTGWGSHAELSESDAPWEPTLRSVLFNSFISGGTVGLSAPSASLQVASDDPSHCTGQWTTTFSPPPQTHSKAQPSPDAERLHCRNCLWWTQTKKDSVIQKISIYSVDSCSNS